MPLVRTIALALLATTLGCEESTGPSRLRVSGTVRSAATDAGVAGAEVRLEYAQAYEPRVLMGKTTTDAQGGYRLTVGKPPGFSGVNCAVMDIIVMIDGEPRISMPLDWLVTVEECRSGTVTVDLELQDDFGQPTS